MTQKLIRALAHITTVAVTTSTPVEYHPALPPADYRIDLEGRLWKRDGHWWELVKETFEGPSAPGCPANSAID